VAALKRPGQGLIPAVKGGVLLAEYRKGVVAGLLPATLKVGRVDAGELAA